MKIIECKLAHYEVPLKTVFKTALHAQNKANGWIVRLKSDQNHEGYGEAIPSLRVTGDSDASIFGVLTQVIFPAIVQHDFENIGKFDDFVSKLLIGNTAAKNAVSQAALDLIIKDRQTSLQHFFGSPKTHITTDYTLSINDESSMAVQAEKLIRAGFSTLKIKLGDSPIQEEVAKLQQLAKEFPKVVFRVDANQAWNIAKSRQFDQLAAAANLPIACIEQPLPVGYEDGYADLTSSSHFPIILDESIHDFNDARKLRPGIDFTGYNVKLEKTAGISQAKALLDYSESLDLPIMVGCMIESNIGIAFAAAMASSYANVRFIDLDSALMFQTEIFKGWLTDEANGYRFNEQFVANDALRELPWQ
ncbi:MAG: dipeptide epimerase [Oenococcus sp.]|uniref:dipeptide epimerase n=1 Tax=Oenococcus sp. TaxID=1979414 RepID=UPI0039EB12F4